MFSVNFIRNTNCKLIKEFITRTKYKCKMSLGFFSINTSQQINYHLQINPSSPFIKRYVFIFGRLNFGIFYFNYFKSFYLVF